MNRYAITTLGCKVNQCESAALGHLMEKAGYRAAEDEGNADVVIINTCTVTGKAAMQSRQATRKAIRNHPGAKIVVTGCYAQTAPDDIRSIKGVDLIVGNRDKLRIAELIGQAPKDASAANLVQRTVFNDQRFDDLPLPVYQGRTRAFLKIQDGCNTMCSYCIVPYARGRSRSMPPEDVQAHMKKLSVAGFHEVVLTGIHLGAYGSDLCPPTTLADLLTDAVHNQGVDRIRLSSIEPTEVESRLMDLVSGIHGRLCRHFHIPLQSGDNAVLLRMRRPYTREQFAEVVSGIHNRVPDAAIGVDVLAGFPGEEDAAFRQTYDLLELLPVTYLHVFPFSPRKGTPAAQFKNQVPERITKERCRRLRLLGEQKKMAFYRSVIGKTLRVLVETAGDARSLPAKGLSDNYIPVLLPGASLKENSFVTTRVVEVREDANVIGEVV